MNELRSAIRRQALETVSALPDGSALARPGLRSRIQDRARELVRHLREDSKPGLMELMLAEYGLSTDEGVALMCLAEALLRVPDSETMDDLIEDKIAPSQWGNHLGRSASPLINSSTWALMMTGRVLDPDTGLGGAPVKTTLRSMIRRLGEPVIRRAVREAMKVMGRQFVLGETIQEAIKRSSGRYRYSYDMLGEAAMSTPDALDYYADYEGAIRALAARCNSDNIADNPGISVKLSALHPRYDEFQRDRVMDELLPRVTELAVMAADARMGFNIDAEESERLELNLDIVDALARDPRLDGWDGLGLVVQAYGTRSPAVIDWVAALAQETGRRLMVRLVKGAYWDTEVKRAQVMGLPRYPVFETKADTDRNYILCAEKLLTARPALYPQFATHNAHTVAAILELAGDTDRYEFQRLHGMGEALHEYLRDELDRPVRIYAPVGEHEDLLAYLVRRLLENGANSSFVSKVTDEDVSIEEIIADPFEDERASVLPRPRDTTEPHANSRGYDLRDPEVVADLLGSSSPRSFPRTRESSDSSGSALSQELDSRVRGNERKGREAFRHHTWKFGSGVEITNPARPSEIVGTVDFADAAETRAAIGRARPWTASASVRARILSAAADALEDAAPELLALLAREAGKTAEDAVSELREAADFLRYYATFASDADQPLGTVAAIAPWNFPLAIFVGEVAGPLAAGNAVIAKPAEATPLIAMRATALMHAAGLPETALQTLPGEGAVVGAALTSDPRIDGVVFTGSTQTAQAIHRSVARHLAPEAPLVAETGGINAMIVDSTALPEQAVADVLASAFQSAGQRCSALRILFVQSDIYKSFLRLLRDAMAELRMGDPWQLSTDVGPVIDERARKGLIDYIAEHDTLFQLEAPADGLFVPPTLIEVGGYEDVTREVFGPVLHVAKFDAEDIPAIIDAVNERDYSLTFGLHTRIDSRVEETKRRLRVGNIYINRNQIGAVVGVQPFGGSALSGTGPKAGGPDYVARFTKQDVKRSDAAEPLMSNPQAVIDASPMPESTRLSVTELPGPTGEDNQLSVYAKGRVLCLGPGEAARAAQVNLAESHGNVAVPLSIAPGDLRLLTGFAVVMHWGVETEQRACRIALSERDGPILPLIVSDDPLMLVREEHVCIDTTASGGNAQLLAAAE
ncbi:MAG: bifunctional proline dehydrogenase/L-glutamate gamma-semialdehyde dehydrogenase PutA [Pseudomonadota bacterium]